MTETISKERLIELTADRAHFSTTIPGLQHAWDSTTLRDLKLCPFKYYLTSIESFRTDEYAKPALKFGKDFHAACEVYDKSRAAGATHDAAQKEAVKYTITQVFKHKSVRVVRCAFCSAEQNDNRNCVNCGNSLDSAEELGTTQITVPWKSDDPLRNWYTLLRAVIWYTEEFQEDTLRTVLLENGKPAVELSYRWKIGVLAPDGQEYSLCGHLDKVVELGEGNFYISDKKTTKSSLFTDYFKKYSMDNQMSGYTLAGKIILHIPVQGVIIDAIQLGVSFVRFRRGMTLRTEEQLDEWLENTIHYIHLAEKYAKERYWPQNDTACDMYGGCEFREFCSKTPSMRMRMLNVAYKRNPWNPLDER